jgi:hypothetical protein
MAIPLVPAAPEVPLVPAVPEVPAASSRSQTVLIVRPAISL